MKEDQIERVRDSFAEVLRVQDAAASLFYGRLFELAPETRALFRNDLAEQGRLLIATLAQVVTGLSHYAQIRGAIEALARRHVGYGADPHHYAAVGAALIHMVEGIGGSHQDAGTADAWRAAYALVSQTMLDAAYGGPVEDHRSAA